MAAAAHLQNALMAAQGLLSYCEGQMCAIGNMWGEELPTAAAAAAAAAADGTAHGEPCSCPHGRRAVRFHRVSGWERQCRMFKPCMEKG